MPQKTYDEQVFCTITDIEQTIKDLEMVIRTESRNSADLPTVIQEFIDTSKNRRLKFDIIKHLRRIYAGTMKKWLQLMRSQVADQLESANREYYLSGSDKIMPEGFLDSINNLQGYTGQGNFIGSLSDEENINILLFFGTPVSGTSGTYAGKKPLTNGSILLDINRTDPRSVYINRGDTDSPIWDTFRPDDAIDYILNPESLINCQISVALAMMAKNGLLANRPGASELHSRMDIINMFENDYDIAKNGAKSEDGKKRIDEGDLSLVNFDISGDGILSDFEQEQNEQQEGIRRFFF